MRVSGAITLLVEKKVPWSINTSHDQSGRSEAHLQKIAKKKNLHEAENSD